MLKLVFYYYSSTINTPPLPIFLPLSKTLLQQWKRKTCGFPFKDWNLRHRKIKGHQKSIQRLPIKQLSFFSEIRTVGVELFWNSGPQELRQGCSEETWHSQGLTTSLLNAVCKAILLTRSYLKSISWPQMDF